MSRFQGPARPASSTGRADGRRASAPPARRRGQTPAGRSRDASARSARRRRRRCTGGRRRRRRPRNTEKPIAPRCRGSPAPCRAYSAESLSFTPRASAAAAPSAAPCPRARPSCCGGAPRRPRCRSSRRASLQSAQRACSNRFTPRLMFGAMTIANLARCGGDLRPLRVVVPGRCRSRADAARPRTAARFAAVAFGRVKSIATSAALSAAPGSRRDGDVPRRTADDGGDVAAPASGCRPTPSRPDEAQRAIRRAAAISARPMRPSRRRRSRLCSSRAFMPLSCASLRRSASRRRARNAAAGCDCACSARIDSSNLLQQFALLVGEIHRRLDHDAAEQIAASHRRAPASRPCRAGGKPSRLRFRRNLQ